jgi:predicted MFS family arabinose efflux permease
MASMKAFTLWFPMSRFATLNGWLLAAGGLGALSASAPVEALLKLTDWRGVFDGLAALTFATAMLVFFVVPERDPGQTRASVRELVAGFGTIYGDPVFWRVAGVSMTAHAAFLATQGLWVAPWLRDIAGFDRSAVAEVLFAMAILTTIGFASTGTISDAVAKHGVAPLFIFKLGAAASVILMATFAFGLAGAAAVTWGLYAALAPVATLSYAILTQRYDRALAGRVNTAVNLLVFVSAFAAQWGIGVILGLWTPAAGRYPVAAYTAAFGTVLALQAVALVPLLTLRKIGRR